MLLRALPLAGLLFLLGAEPAHAQFGPFCGDNIINQPEEECDGFAFGACPPFSCDANCLCPPETGGSCGDGAINQPSEVCDGFDDLACLGSCDANCLCPPAEAGGISVENGPGSGICGLGPLAGQVCVEGMGDCSACFEGGDPCDSDDDCPGMFNGCVGYNCAITQLPDMPVYSWRQCPECGASSILPQAIDPFLPPEPPDPIGGLCQFLALGEDGAAIGVNRFFPNSGSVCCAWDAACSSCSVTQGVKAIQWTSTTNVQSENYSWPGSTSGTLFATSDHDEWPDFCDNCPAVWNNDQADDDGDAVGNPCDPDFLPEPGRGLPLGLGVAALGALRGARGRRSRQAG